MSWIPSLAAPAREATRGTHPVWRVAAIALTWFACTAWLRPLSLPDEGRYVGVAWEMLRSGNWVVPTLDGMPFLHKPPLFYWITAFALHLFGPHEWAARCASMGAAALTVAVLYATLRDWFGERAARTSALVLATQPLFFGAAQFANLDMLVAACISISILLGAKAAWRFERGENCRSELTGLYVALGCGLLAKGLIGIVIPVAVLTAWLGVVGHWRALRVLCWLPGAAIIGVIALPWMVATQAQHTDFLHYFFVVQHFQRFAGNGFNGVQPVWFYVPVLLVLTLPWSAWLAMRWRGARRSTPQHPSIVSLWWLWLLGVLVFFSIPQSKLVGYVLPALPALAALVGTAIAPAAARAGRTLRWWRISLVGAVALCTCAAIAFAVVDPKSSRSLAQPLSALRLPGEHLAFVDTYLYDVPFYLKDNTPIAVVSNWDPADVQAHDNWRKELADAGRFAPALAAERLIDDRQFAASLCARRIQWVIAKPQVAESYAFARVVPVTLTDGRYAAWHIEATQPRVRTALGCDEAMPTEPGH